VQLWSPLCCHSCCGCHLDCIADDAAMQHQQQLAQHQVRHAVLQIVGCMLIADAHNSVHEGHNRMSAVLFDVLEIWCD